MKNLEDLTNHEILLIYSHMAKKKKIVIYNHAGNAIYVSFLGINLKVYFETHSKFFQWFVELKGNLKQLVRDGD